MILHYDTETTGFLNRGIPFHDPRQARIVQIGAILDNDDREEVMRIDLVLAQPPEVDFSSDAVKVHGISKEVSQTIGVNETRALELFLDMLDVADLVVGQNILGFDNDIVTCAVRRIHGNTDENPFEGKKFFDTMIAAQPICKIPGARGGFKKPNLTEIHNFFFQKGFDNAHCAISDVMAARRCFYALQDLVKKGK